MRAFHARGERVHIKDVFAFMLQLLVSEGIKSPLPVTQIEPLS